MRRLTARCGAAGAIVLISLVATAGCGGDTRRAGTAPTVPSPSATTATGAALVPMPVAGRARRAYVTRVDRICGRMDPERNRAREDARGGLPEVARRYDDSIALGARELQMIQAITPPRGDERALRANVFGVIARQLAVRRRIHTALVARDLSAVTSLQAQLDELTRSLVGFARGYGFKVCGTD